MKSLRHLRSNIERTHVFIIGSHKKREKGPEKIFEEISAEKFPDMGKVNSQSCPESSESPRQDKHKEEHSRLTIIQLTKIKDKENFTATRKNQQKDTKELP